MTISPLLPFFSKIVHKAIVRSLLTVSGCTGSPYSLSVRVQTKFWHRDYMGHAGQWASPDDGWRSDDHAGIIKISPVPSIPLITRHYSLVYRPFQKWTRLLFRGFILFSDISLGSCEQSLLFLKSSQMWVATGSPSVTPPVQCVYKAACGGNKEV